MLFISLILTFFIFFIGLIMFFINGNKNLIFILISLEVLLLASALFFVHTSFLLDDAIGITIALLILPIAGAESAFGLALLINYYPNKGSLSITPVKNNNNDITISTK